MTVTMIAVVEAMVEDVMITVADTVAMIVIVDMAEIVTITLLAELTDMVVEDVMTTEVVDAMIDEVAVEDTLIVTLPTEAIVAQLVMHHLQPMETQLQLPEEKLGNHMEVEATMMRDHPVANTDC